MKRILAILLLLVLGPGAMPLRGIAAAEQSPRPRGAEASPGAMPLRGVADIYEGSMMPYDFAAVDSLAAWPDSLTPVGVLYVARHGSRYMTGPHKIDNLREILYQAALRREITRPGERFLRLLGEVERVSKGRWGELSPVGIREQMRLGADMRRRYGRMLRGATADCAATFVPRAMMTMFEFLHSLELREQSLEIYTNSGPQNDSLLRCFEADSAYAAFREDSGAWQPVYEEFVDAYVPVAPARRILGMENDNDLPRLRALTMEIYGVLQSLRAMGLSSAVSEYMDEEEFRLCWEASNLKHCLRNTLTPVSGLCAEATRPLIERLVADGDEIFGDIGEEPEAVLPRFRGYFGHAETLLPLLSVIDVPGCRAPADDFASVEAMGRLAESWRVYDITPLGANLEIALLRGPSGAAYAALRLNGRNVRPWPDAPAMFAPWRELTLRWLESTPLRRR